MSASCATCRRALDVGVLADLVVSEQLAVLGELQDERTVNVCDAPIACARRCRRLDATSFVRETRPRSRPVRHRDDPESRPARCCQRLCDRRQIRARRRHRGRVGPFFDDELARAARRERRPRGGDDVLSRAAVERSNGDDGDRQLALRTLVRHRGARTLAEDRLPSGEFVDSTSYFSLRSSIEPTRYVTTSSSPCVAQVDERARLDDVAGGAAVDDDRVLQHLLELADAGLVEAVLVLGRVVVGVLLEVAVLAGPLDPQRQLPPARRGAFLEFRLQALVGLRARGGARPWRAGYRPAQIGLTGVSRRAVD